MSIASVVAKLVEAVELHPTCIYHARVGPHRVMLPHVTTAITRTTECLVAAWKLTAHARLCNVLAEGGACTSALAWIGGQIGGGKEWGAWKQGRLRGYDGTADGWQDKLENVVIRVYPRCWK